MSFTMGLYVMPKHKNCSPIEVYTVEGYLERLLFLIISLRR